MIYSEAIDAIRRNAFPEGEARNLRSRNSNLILDCIIDLQRYVPRMRGRQFTIYPFYSTKFNCGQTIIEKPNRSAKIMRVYTYTMETHCDAIYYHWVTRAEFDRVVFEKVNCCDSPEDMDVNDGDTRSDSARGHTMANSSNDKDDRALWGYYTIVDDEIFMYPHINSDERVVVEWRGVKYEFDDDDIVAWDRDILRAAELWLRYDTAMRDTCDAKDYEVFKIEYANHKANLIAQDKDEGFPDEGREPYACCSPYALATQDAETGECEDDPMTRKSVFDSLTDFRTSTVTCTMAFIEEDGNGNPGWFKIKEDGISVTDDGVNYVKDATGQPFYRTSPV